MRSAYLCKEKKYICISILVHMFSVKLHEHDNIFNSVFLTFPPISEGKQEDFPWSIPVYKKTYQEKDIPRREATLAQNPNQPAVF